jgi:hypothetical protein
MKNLPIVLLIFSLALGACAPTIPTATPTMTPAATPTPSQAPTASLVPTETPTETPTLRPTETPTDTASPTPVPTDTATNTPAPTATSFPVTVTVTAQMSASSDDVNQDGGAVEGNAGTIWLGTGSSNSYGYTGLRFARLVVPPHATVVSAWLMVYSSQNQWIGLNLSIGADATGNSPTFSDGSLPSQRALTTRRAAHSSNVEWQANTWYALAELAPVVQEIVNRSDWRSGNSMALIVTGMGSTWGRKFVMSFDGSPSVAPRLVIKYRVSSEILLQASQTAEAATAPARTPSPGTQTPPPTPSAP